MTKLVRFVVLAACLLVTSSAFSNVWHIDYNYYSDGTFTTWVGEQDLWCDDTEIDSGTTSDWRVRDRWLCNDGTPDGHRCQQFVNGSWVFVTCPPGV